MSQNETGSAPDNAMSLADLHAYAQRLVAQDGTQAAFARKHGVSMQYLNDFLRKRREPGRKILAALGVKKLTYYRLP
jgi:hypothetical protein